jgi:hypothetical protein
MAMDKDGYTSIVDISECKLLQREFGLIEYVYEKEKLRISYKRNTSQNKWKICILDQLNGFHPFDAAIRAKSFRRFATFLAATVPYIVNDIIRNAAITRWSRRWSRSKDVHIMECHVPAAATPLHVGAEPPHANLGGVPQRKGMAQGAISSKLVAPNDIPINIPVHIPVHIPVDPTVLQPPYLPLPEYISYFPRPPDTQWLDTQQPPDMWRDYSGCMKRQSMDEGDGATNKHMRVV